MTKKDLHDEDVLWHELTPQKTLNKLHSSLEGLHKKEAEKRLALHGKNILKTNHKNSTLKRFISQFNNVLLYLLMGSCVITSILGHWVDTSVIASVMIINAIIGFIQEGKAEKALEAVTKLLTHTATVIRENKRYEILAEELVPGDIVFLQSGNKIPADLRILKVHNLQVNEALLTGESMSIEKNIDPLSHQTPLAERLNSAYSGTFVTYGQGFGVVVNTGENTEIGRISKMLQEIKKVTTPLLNKIAVLGKWITIATILFAILTFFIGYFFRDFSINELFLIAVGLAVAAIPEGLPAVMTITLAIGVQRMAHRNVIIRRLPAVETLGAVTTICTDKTGTLTCNEMTVKKIITSKHVFDISGEGYIPNGELTLNKKNISTDDYPELIDFAQAGLLCNEASLHYENNEWIIEGDPTDASLVVLAAKLGLNQQFIQKSFPKIDTIPFESQHRFMASLHHDHNHHKYIYIKGAPERIFEMCTTHRLKGENTPINLKAWHKKMEEAARLGYRLIAIAMKNTNDDHSALQFSNINNDFTLLVVFGIIDPPRKEASKSIANCLNAGIKIKMITGDHLITAQAIGAKIGLFGSVNAIRGEDLENLNTQQFNKTIANTSIFARTNPEIKFKIVEALQKQNEIVAMTGDGANDAPALKRADIGIAMGKRGTEVAKQAAEMVITDDNFASISHAIEEGRTVYNNLRKAIVYILPTSAAEAFILFIALLLGIAMPITPVQILWINMVTAVTLSMSLAFEKPENDIMNKSPRNPDEAILSWFLTWRIFFVSFLLVVGALLLFLFEQSLGSSLQTSRTVAVNTLVMGEIFYLFNCKHMTNSIFHIRSIFNNKYVFGAILILLILQAIFTSTAPFHHLFGVTNLNANAWLRIVIFGWVFLLIMEIEKLLIRMITKLAFFKSN